MSSKLHLFPEHATLQSSNSLKLYSDWLTADVNQKGVLDVDTVKGCSLGMSASPQGGCYQCCYAAKIAKFRGLKFEAAIVRRVHTKVQARKIVDAVRNAPEGFFRVGTMGDPSHAWEHTVKIIEWLAPYATPVVVTKHWMLANDAHVARLVACGAVLNTSVSALDTKAQLSYRLEQIVRYSKAGGVSVARVVSCLFNMETEEGRQMQAVQSRLLALPLVIDNPLRAGLAHPLVASGVVLVQPHQDLGEAPVLISKHSSDAYTGSCRGCKDKCGLAFRGKQHPHPQAAQGTFSF